MAQLSANPVITELRERIAHLEGGLVRRNQVLPFGVREIDEHLPGRGLSFGAVHEFAGGGSGTVDGAAAALFAAGIAIRQFNSLLGRRTGCRACDHGNSRAEFGGR
jgi:protein ImuA